MAQNDAAKESKKKRRSFVCSVLNAMGNGKSNEDKEVLVSLPEEDAVTLPEDDVQPKIVIGGGAGSAFSRVQKNDSSAKQPIYHSESAAGKTEAMKVKIAVVETSGANKEDPLSQRITSALNTVKDLLAKFEDVAVTSSDVQSELFKEM